MDFFLNMRYLYRIQTSTARVLRKNRRQVDNFVLRSMIDWVSVLSRFMAFSYGIFDFSALIYYVSIVAVFLFLTVRVYEKRRWD